MASHPPSTAITYSFTYFEASEARNTVPASARANDIPSPRPMLAPVTIGTFPDRLNVLVLYDSLLFSFLY